MAASGIDPSTPSPDIEAESAPGLDALLWQIKGYLSACKLPADDWRLIKDRVEQGIGLVELREQSRRAAELDRSHDPEDETMSESKPSSMTARPVQAPNLAELLQSVLDDPETWLSTPSLQFGGRKPRDLIGTAEEPKLFDLLRAVDQGLF